jgi:integration host factor subunit alpha
MFSSQYPLCSTLRSQHHLKEIIMTKADLVNKIHTSSSISKKESFDIVEAVFSIMKDTLEAGEKIKVAGFGNFEVREKKDRKGRNPQTGETITIAARKVLIFRPSGILKAAINNG